MRSITLLVAVSLAVARVVAGLEFDFSTPPWSDWTAVSLPSSPVPSRSASSVIPPASHSPTLKPPTTTGLPSVPAQTPVRANRKIIRSSGVHLDDDINILRLLDPPKSRYSVRTSTLNAKHIENLFFGCPGDHSLLCAHFDFDINILRLLDPPKSRYSVRISTLNAKLIDNLYFGCPGDHSFLCARFDSDISILRPLEPRISALNTEATDNR